MIVFAPFPAKSVYLTLKINIRTHVNEAVWFCMFDDSGDGGHQSARAHGHYDSVHIRQLFEDLYGYTAVSR